MVRDSDLPLGSLIVAGTVSGVFFLKKKILYFANSWGKEPNNSLGYKISVSTTEVQSAYNLKKWMLLYPSWPLYAWVSTELRSTHMIGGTLRIHLGPSYMSMDI